MRMSLALRERLYETLPKPAARRAGDFRGGAEVRRVLVLSKPGNPTFSYYFEDRLADLPVPFTVRPLDESLAAVDPCGTFVILCRYARPGQLRWLYRHRHSLAGIGLFVDDDIASTVVSADGPLDYRTYLLATGVLPLVVLNRLMTHLWASTETLAGTFRRDGLPVAVLPPRPRPEQYRPEAADLAENGPVRMVFHATGAHFSEHRFLIPVVAEAVARHAHLSFEVIAEGASARWWRALAVAPQRLRIRPPLKWPDYLRQTARQPADIALVPLLPGRTNDRRSDTKRIDIARMRAAAIYSDCDIYRRCAVAGDVFAGNTPEAWQQEIGRLVTEPAYRQRARKATMASMALMREAAPPGFPGLLTTHREASHGD